MRMSIGAAGESALIAVGIVCVVIFTGCIKVTDVTGQPDNPVVKANPYCRRGAEFVVAYPLQISMFCSRAGGHTLYEDSDISGNRTDFGPNDAMQAAGYLRPGETVRVERVIWVEHFDVGDHVEIRATVLNGRYKGMAVDLKNVQNEKLLKKAGGAGGGTPGE